MNETKQESSLMAMKQISVSSEFWVVTAIQSTYKNGSRVLSDRSKRIKAVNEIRNILKAKGLKAEYRFPIHEKEKAEKMMKRFKEAKIRRKGFKVAMNKAFSLSCF